MSSGPAITMSERNIENIKISPMIFGGPKNEGLAHNDSSPIAFEVENPSSTPLNHTTKPREKFQLRSGDAGDSRSNNVLKPAKNENLKVKVLKKSMSPKPEPTSNYIIENKLPVQLEIGASGDGLPQNEKLVFVVDQNNPPVVSDQVTSSLFKEPRPVKKEFQPENARFSNKTSAQTYAKVTQNLKTEESKTESVSFLCKPVANAPTSVKTQGNDSTTPVMNGVVEDASASGSPVTVTSTKSPSPVNASYRKSQSRMKLLIRSKAVCHDDLSINLDSSYPWESPFSSSSASISDSIFPSPFPISREDALKETSGHVSRLPGNSTNSRFGADVRSNEQDVQILSNPERPTEDGGSESQQNESLISNTDADYTLSSKLGSASGLPRREAEKPPRMQKQRSQDRLLLKQQKPSFESESKRETLSRESSVECVDSTGVDVHEFLISTLRNSTRDRAILLKIEHDMINFVNNKTSDFMKFPPMTSYHRMLVHRVAAYFGMDHNVDETGRSVIINKTNTTRLPEVWFAEQFDPRQPDQHSARRDDDMRRRSILKRTNQSRSFDRDDMKGGNLWKDRRQHSIEEREERYEKVRARIFNNPEANMNSAPMYGRRALSSLAAARMAFWSDRPWNSTDVDPSMRMPGPRLTTRASSYSSISVLPRHNSATSVKTGSSSSVSSMNGVNSNMQNFAQGRQTHNMGPRPPTPGRRSGMGDNNNGAYYYMQHQNQDLPFDAVEDDIAQSWFPESPEPLTPCSPEVIVPTDAPILLAVPYGTTLPPETVLCHPITGLPYLSPEGYQLVYQGGAPGSAGNSGMASPQLARYYQIPPPQPSPQHPGMGYPQGFNPYEEPSHKAQGLNTADYTMVSPMSSHRHNVPSTSTVYSGVQGQPSIGYSYQGAAVYRPTSEPPMAMPPQVGMQPAAQGKQTPIMQQGGQNYIQHPPPPGAMTYPPYVFAPPPGPLQLGQSTKEDPQSQNLAGATAPRNMMAQPVPGGIQQAPPMYPGQQPMPAVFSPPVGPNLAAHPSNSTEGYYQNEPPMSSNPTQGGKKATEDELSDKMQAIVLKNLQQQQQGQHLPDSSACESTNTVTTSLNPSAIPIQNSKPVPEIENQNRTMVNPTHHRHPPEPQGYPQYQYMNGMQQSQPMQVYLMPNNNTAPGASYRTYSQFMTQPQTPHVMGPGMQFVYLSPPPMTGGVMGMEAGGTAMNTHPNSTVCQTDQIQHQNQPVRQEAETKQTYTSNTNNNNATKAVHRCSQLANVIVTQKAKPKEGNEATQESNAKRQKAQADEKTAGDCLTVSVQNGGDTQNVAETLSVKKDSENTGTDDVSSNAAIEQVTKSKTAIATISSNEPRPVTANSSNRAYHMHNHPLIHHQHNNTPVLLSNMPQDYRITGMNMTSPVSYPAGVIPQYSMYPNIGPAPYVYLPAAAASARSPRLPDMKVFPQAAAQTHSPGGLIAVQLPNQNQIQFVSASSLQNQIYYTPQNYMTSDYTSQAQVPVQSFTYPPAKPETASQPNGHLQVHAETVTAENATPARDKDAGATAETSDENRDEAEPKDPATAMETVHEAQ